MTDLVAHSLLYEVTDRKKNSMKAKIDPHTFYVRDGDVETLKFLVTLAKCPLGELILNEHIGLGYTIPNISPQ